MVVTWRIIKATVASLGLSVRPPAHHLAITNAPATPLTTNATATDPVFQARAARKIRGERRRMGRQTRMRSRSHVEQAPSHTVGPRLYGCGTWEARLQHPCRSGNAGIPGSRCPPSQSDPVCAVVVFVKGGSKHLGFPGQQRKRSHPHLRRLPAPESLLPQT